MDSREGMLRNLESRMLGRTLMKARERLKVKRSKVEGKSDLITGLPDFLVEHHIWLNMRDAYDDVGQKTLEEKEEALELYRNLRSLNSKWRCLVEESEGWAAFRLVNADFRDDDLNLSSIRLVDQRACCHTKLSEVVEMLRGTVGVAGLSLFELRQLRAFIEKEVHGSSVSYSGMRGCEVEEKELGNGHRENTK